MDILLLYNDVNFSSMLPLIQPNDELMLSNLNKIKLNDILVFKKGKKLIGHRLIYVHPHKKYYLTKGDNNPKPDKKIYFHQILGKVESLKRNHHEVSLKHIYLSQSISYQQELEKISKALRKNKIPWILLKGLPVHLYVNQKPPDYIYADLDILINESSYKKTSKILKSLGYIPQKNSNLDKHQTQINFINTKILPFPVVIDLHTQPAISFTKTPHLNELAPNSLLLSKTLFKNITHTDDGLKIPVLNSTTLFIFLLVHLYHHNFNGAKRYQLIVDLIEKKRVSWKKSAITINKLKLNNIIFIPILLLRKYYLPQIPNDFIIAISPKKKTHIFFSKLIATTTNPFNKDSINIERIKKFLLIIFLSTKPASEKIKIIFNRKTLYLSIYTIKSFFFSNSKNSSTSSTA